MNKKWEYYALDTDKANKIAETFQINPIIAGILLNRGIQTEEEIKTFLNPTRNDFHDPFLMPDMEKAIDRLLKAMEKKEKIVIYGDYDVDGITSITVLKSFLEERGLEVKAHIPNRLEEGYGLNKEAIEKLAKEGYPLMITVDCGISGIEEVEYAKSLGMETIVTDHHEPLENLPEAVAVIDAKRKDNHYPFNQLAGVGVVFKLIQAFGIRLGLEEKEYLKYLDIVCVGTISDIVPLVDENRVIAKLGLRLVERTRNIGLRALLNASGYKRIDSNAISFGIAPRINACGRMGYQEEALKLFLTKDEKEAEVLTQKLNSYNLQRQETEKRIYAEALQMLEKEKPEDRNVIVLGGDNWHHGVIGIVASKITDMYFKPSILLCFEDQIGKGSGRSIPGFDLHEALCQCSSSLERFGGHAMAVGLSVKKEDFETFKNKMEQVASKQNIQEMLPVIYLDGQITLKDMNRMLVDQLKLLEPFGEANKMPLFVYQNLKINSIRALSEGKHLKLTLKDEGYLINAIGFNMGSLAEEYLIGDKVDIVGVLEVNSFNGKDTIQINLKDIRKSYCS